MVALRQIARTPRRPYMPPLRGVPYAFAIEIRKFPGVEVIKVRCPWCGHSHTYVLRDGQVVQCENGMGQVVIATPEGTPILVPAETVAR